MKTGSTLAIIVFTLVALAHLARIITGTSLTVGETSIPQWVSLLGVVGPGLIATLLWRENR